MSWREQRRRALARGRAARRPGRLLDPPRRRQRGALRPPQPRRPHRRRARRGGREPPPARGGARLRARAGRRSAARSTAPSWQSHAAAQSPSPFAEPGAADPPRSTATSSRPRRPGLARARLRRRLPAGRPRRARAAWRCCTAAGAGSPPGSSPAAPRRSARPTPRSAPGIGPCCYEVGDEVLDAFADLGPGVAIGSHARPRRGRPPSARARPGSSGSRSPASARAASRSCSSPTAATAAGPAARRASSGLEGATEVAGADPRARPGARSRANLERVREPGRGRGSRSSPRPSTCRSRRWARWPRPGSTLVGENRQQDLAAKRERWGDAFEWDFIGNLQSRKVRQLLPACRLIHSVASDSALAELGQATAARRPRSWSRSTSPARRARPGSPPSDLGEFIERLPGPRHRADDDAARSARTRRPRGPISPASRSSPPSTAWRGSRWAPRRIGRSRSRRARRSSAWARRCSCESAPNRA